MGQPALLNISSLVGKEMPLKGPCIIINFSHKLFVLNGSFLVRYWNFLNFFVIIVLGLSFLRLP